MALGGIVILWWAYLARGALLIIYVSWLLAIGFSPLIPSKYLVAWAATRGGELWDPNTQKCIANDAKNKPIFVDLFKWYKKYTDKYGAEEMQSYITSYQGNNFGRNTPEGVYYTGRLAIKP